MASLCRNLLGSSKTIQVGVTSHRIIHKQTWPSLSLFQNCNFSTTANSDDTTTNTNSDETEATEAYDRRPTPNENDWPPEEKFPNFDPDLPQSTYLYDGATRLQSPLPSGKIVHPPGTPRIAQRSEVYGFKIYNSHGPNDNVTPHGDSIRNGSWSNPLANVAPQKFCSMDGQTYIIGADKSIFESYWFAQRNTPWTFGNINMDFKTRTRQNIFSNYDYIMKMDYCMFWIPSFIIFCLTIPSYCTGYMMDELTYNSMTVKVIGRQWYWVYEVESPVDEEEEEEDDE